MFGKNAMLKLHVMLLCNHSITVYTCMTSESRKSSPKSAYSMYMWTTCPKRVRSGQSENELKKQDDSAGLSMDCPWVWKYNRHGPSQVHMIWSYKFFWDSRCMSRSLKKKILKHNPRLKSLLGLMCKTKHPKTCWIYVISNIFGQRGRCVWLLPFQRAIERLLTHSTSPDRRIDVHVIFNRFQPYQKTTGYAYWFRWIFKPRL